MLNFLERLLPIVPADRSIPLERRLVDIFAKLVGVFSEQVSKHSETPDLGFARNGTADEWGTSEIMRRMGTSKVTGALTGTVHGAGGRLSQQIDAFSHEDPGGCRDGRRCGAPFFGCPASRCPTLTPAGCGRRQSVGHSDRCVA
jgi:hypothetical protein